MFRRLANQKVGQRAEALADPRPIPREDLAVQEMKAAGRDGRDLSKNAELCEVLFSEGKWLVRQEDHFWLPRRHLP